MKQLFIFLILLSVIAGTVLYVQSVNNPCNHTLEYGIGSFDDRFGITQDEFLKNVGEMESVWENAAGGQLFVYNPQGEFKINLIFDERQQKTNDERQARQEINLYEESYDKLVAQYNSLNYQHQQALHEYEQKQRDYQTRLAAYNTEVSYWNKNGGASGEDYKRLTQEKKNLSIIASQLDQERLAINANAADLNTFVGRINDLAKKLNLNVHDYNGKFGESRQFDQGLYTGNAINIYQFNEVSDLRLVLAHELGHALKLEHIDDPKAIMYYLMGQQDLENINLTDGDLVALKSVCHIR